MGSYDVERLRDLWVNKRYSAGRIASIFDVHISTIYRRLKRHGIERRDLLQYNTIGKGYTEIAEPGEGGERVYAHRLLAVAEYGFDAVADEDNVVHHKNGVTWDNRPSNIRLLTNEVHARKHANEQEREDSGCFRATNS